MCLLWAYGRVSTGIIMQKTRTVAAVWLGTGYTLNDSQPFLTKLSSSDNQVQQKQELPKNIRLKQVHRVRVANPQNISKDHRFSLFEIYNSNWYDLRMCIHCFLPSRRRITETFSLHSFGILLAILIVYNDRHHQGIFIRVHNVF